ncbi:MAG TPA: chemotaxis protein [Alphaproteobacteria bacterium]|nr:chemotaxis protein [Alphaproteobacteria bacterium]
MAREMAAPAPRRYYDPGSKLETVEVTVGQHVVLDRGGAALVTTLGSCVAACIRDPVAGIGGMNHFLLPQAPGAAPDGVSAAARYGSVAMERLINELLARGGQRGRLEVKLFGGADMGHGALRIGTQNCLFVRAFLAREGLAVAAQDLGGSLARRVHYYPMTGRVMRRLLRPDAVRRNLQVEAAYLRRLRAEPIEGEVELFEDDTP